MHERYITVFVGYVCVSLDEAHGVCNTTRGIILRECGLEARRLFPTEQDSSGGTLLMQA